MTAPAIVAQAVPDTCSACGCALGDDQRSCLNCGEPRAGARRPLPAALRSPRLASHERAAAPREAPSVAAVLAGLACLLLAMGVGVLIGRGAGEPVAPAPVTVAAAGAAAPAAPATASFTSDWPAGKDGWTVALALLPVATATPAAITQAKAAAAAKGASAPGALDAGAYPSLTAGSYVVYSGVFDSEAAANAARAKLLRGFPDARVVRVATAAAVASRTTKKATTSKRAAGAATQQRPASGSGGSDTTKEFEKSKKAPKTVGTGGTPPAKDHKPAAGGGDFQEIG